jgi:signal transduction histidine kinase
MLTETALTRALTNPRRLDLLSATKLLDSPPEEAFDRFTRMASNIIHAPVALISLVDTKRQFFKSQFGLHEPFASARQTPLSLSFCKHLVGTSMPLIVADAREHPLLRFNEGIEHLQVIAYLGVPLQTADGHTLGSLCTIDAKPRVWTEREIGILKDLGIWVMTEVQLRVMAGHLLGSYVHARDIELQRDELVQMLVHDLRNPLHSLMAGLELVEDAPGLSAKEQRYVGIAQESAQKLLRMVNDILDVSKSEAGKMTLDAAMTPPQEIIVAACRQTEGLAKTAGVTIIQDWDEKLAPIMVDTEKMRRVLVNLISNAIQHTSHPGTVRVAARPRWEQNSLVIEVTDTGVGLPTEAYKQIFEKFGRVESRKGGRISTGLGLPFCKKAIEAHGGRISVESEIGQGTVFRIEIPYDGPFPLPTDQ